MEPLVRVANEYPGVDSFDRIVAALQEAALDHSLWLRAMALIDDACELHGSHMFLVQDSADAPPTYLCGKYLSQGIARDDIEQRYASSCFQSDARVLRLLRMPAGCLLRNDDLLDEQEQQASSAYAEYLRTWGAVDQLNVRLDVADDLKLFWTIARSTTNGAWRHSQLRLLQRLLPHIGHAVRVSQALRQAGARQGSE